MRTISDEELRRLADLSADDAKDWAWSSYPSEAVASIARELLSLRAPPSGEAGERADHLRMLAFRDILEFRPDSTTGTDAYEQIAIHARSTVIETQRAIALLPTIKEPTDGK